MWKNPKDYAQNIRYRLMEVSYSRRHPYAPNEMFFLTYPCKVKIVKSGECLGIEMRHNLKWYDHIKLNANYEKKSMDALIFKKTSLIKDLSKII